MEIQTVISIIGICIYVWGFILSVINGFAICYLKVQSDFEFIVGALIHSATLAPEQGCADSRIQCPEFPDPTAIFRESRVPDSQTGIVTHTSAPEPLHWCTDVCVEGTEQG